MSDNELDQIGTGETVEDVIGTEPAESEPAADETTPEGEDMLSAVVSGIAAAVGSDEVKTVLRAMMERQRAIRAESERHRGILRTLSNRELGILLIHEVMRPSHCSCLEMEIADRLTPDLQDEEIRALAEKVNKLTEENPGE